MTYNKASSLSPRPLTAWTKDVVVKRSESMGSLAPLRTTTSLRDSASRQSTEGENNLNSECNQDDTEKNSSRAPEYDRFHRIFSTQQRAFSWLSTSQHKQDQRHQQYQQKKSNNDNKNNDHLRRSSDSIAEQLESNPSNIVIGRKRSSSIGTETLRRNKHDTNANNNESRGIIIIPLIWRTRLQEILPKFCEYLAHPTWDSAAAACALFSQGNLSINSSTPDSNTYHARIRRSSLRTQQELENEEIDNEDKANNNNADEPATSTTSSESRSSWQAWVSPFFLLACAQALHADMEMMITKDRKKGNAAPRSNSKESNHEYHLMNHWLELIQRLIQVDFIPMVNSLKQLQLHQQQIFYRQNHKQQQQQGQGQVTWFRNQNEQQNLQQSQQPRQQKQEQQPIKNNEKQAVNSQDDEEDDLSSLIKTLQGLIAFLEFKSQWILFYHSPINLPWLRDFSQRIRSPNNITPVSSTLHNSASNNSEGDNNIDTSQRKTETVADMETEANSWGACYPMVQAMQCEVKLTISLLETAYWLEQGRFMETIIHAKQVQRNLDRLIEFDITTDVAATKAAAKSKPLMTSTTTLAATTLQRWYSIILEDFLSTLPLLFDRIRTFATPLYGFNQQLLQENCRKSGGVRNRDLPDLNAMVLEFLRRQSRSGGNTTAVTIILMPETASTDSAQQQQQQDRNNANAAARRTSPHKSQEEQRVLTSQERREQRQQEREQQRRNRRPPRIEMGFTLFGNENEGSAEISGEKNGNNLGNSANHSRAWVPIYMRTTKYMSGTSSNLGSGAGSSGSSTGGGGPIGLISGIRAHSQSNLLLRSPDSSSNLRSKRNSGAGALGKSNSNVFEYRHAGDNHASNSKPLSWPYSEWSQLETFLDSLSNSPSITPAANATMTASPEKNSTETAEAVSDTLTSTVPGEASKTTGTSASTSTSIPGATEAETPPKSLLKPTATPAKPPKPKPKPVLAAKAAVMAKPTAEATVETTSTSSNSTLTEEKRNEKGGGKRYFKKLSFQSNPKNNGSDDSNDGGKNSNSNDDDSDGKDASKINKIDTNNIDSKQDGTLFMTVLGMMTGTNLHHHHISQEEKPSTTNARAVSAAFRTTQTVFHAIRLNENMWMAILVKGDNTEENRWPRRRSRGLDDNEILTFLYEMVSKLKIWSRFDVNEEIISQLRAQEQSRIGRRRSGIRRSIRAQIGNVENWKDYNQVQNFCEMLKHSFGTDRASGQSNMNLQGGGGGSIRSTSYSRSPNRQRRRQRGVGETDDTCCGGGGWWSSPSPSTGTALEDIGSKLSESAAALFLGEELYHLVLDEE